MAWPAGAGDRVEQLIRQWFRGTRHEILEWSMACYAKGRVYELDNPVGVLCIGNI